MREACANNGPADAGATGACTARDGAQSGALAAGGQGIDKGFAARAPDADTNSTGKTMAAKVTAMAE